MTGLHNIDLTTSQKIEFSAKILVRGGQGVAREVADLILDARFDLDKLYAQMASGQKGKIVQ